MVTFENVSKLYDDGEGGYLAVDHLNLEVSKGELVVLIGPSGCGKTTTLKMVNRLIEPTEGKIYVEGQDTQDLNPVELRRKIGYVIQQIGLFPHMTIGENIALVPRLLGWPKEKRAERADELLNMVRMDPKIYRDRYPKELSGGQQQRIGVLRALAAEPDIILMDEPFGALDPLTRDQLQDELKKLQERVHKTIIFVTHDMDEALKLADRIVMMRKGKVVQAASPDEMLRNPANEFVTNFIGRDRLLRSPDEVNVEDVMIEKPVTIEINKGLAEGLERMRKRRVDSLMVVNKADKLKGVVTIKDIQMSFDKANKIGDLINGTLVAIEKGNTVREAVYKMAEHNIGYLPVVDADGHLTGLITRSSLVDILTDVLWLNGESA